VIVGRGKRIRKVTTLGEGRRKKLEIGDHAQYLIKFIAGKKKKLRSTPKPEVGANERTVTKGIAAEEARHLPVHKKVYEERGGRTS